MRKMGRCFQRCFQDIDEVRNSFLYRYLTMCDSVQVPPSAVEKERSQVNPETFSFSEAKTRLVPTVQVLRFASVVPEPTSPGRRGFSPAGSVSPSTEVPRTSWDPPSANVRPFLFSGADGLLSPMFKVVFVSLPSAQNQGPTNLFIDTVHMKC